MQSSLGGKNTLGPQLVGEKFSVNNRVVSVTKQLGEGGFSFIYLAKDVNDTNADNSTHKHAPSRVNEDTGGSDKNGRHGGKGDPNYLVLKITSIHSRQQRDIAEKEANLLKRLNHPSIVRMMDTCYRMPSTSSDGGGGKHVSKLANIVGVGGGSSSGGQGSNNIRPQHLILMEYCEGGTALSVCESMSSRDTRFDLPGLIIAFGQICNAVSYLHAQRPPIVHRDLKPVNFLVKNGAYKVCDFGSAVFGHVNIGNQKERAEAEEIIQKTTTQMFRSPEMVDLYMTEKLTQSTDVWALGCCLYSMAYFQNCFEEGSNLAILSRNYRIPDDNPYGDGLVELIDRMLTLNHKERADMTEVILCLSAIYSGKPLPPRRRAEKEKKRQKKLEDQGKIGIKERVGKFRTDGQGIRKPLIEEKKSVEAKKLNPNSAAARRRKAAQSSAGNKMASQNNTLSSSNEDKNIGFEASFGNDFNQTSGTELANNGSNDPFEIGGSNGSKVNAVTEDISFEQSRLDNGTIKDEFHELSLKQRLDEDKVLNDLLKNTSDDAVLLQDGSRKYFNSNSSDSLENDVHRRGRSIPKSSSNVNSEVTSDILRLSALSDQDQESYIRSKSLNHNSKTRKDEIQQKKKMKGVIKGLFRKPEASNEV